MKISNDKAQGIHTGTSKPKSYRQSTAAKHRQSTNNMQSQTRMSAMTSFIDDENLACASPEIHHQMSTSRRHWVNIPEWLMVHSTDPACVVRSITSNYVA
jgi:hypothetical protein